MTRLVSSNLSEPKWIRIVPRNIKAMAFVLDNADRCFQVLATVAHDEGYDMVIVDYDRKATENPSHDSTVILDERDIEYITEKEFFSGVLKHG